MSYFIIETSEGWTVAELPPECTADEVAAQFGATLIDSGPFDSYEEATDALVSLQGELAEDADASDLPGTQALEGRESDAQ